MAKKAADLEKKIREFGTLSERVSECRRRIGQMCVRGRPPRMSIPVHWNDDDMFINTTLMDVINLIKYAKAAMEMQDLLGDEDSGIRINAKASSEESMQRSISISQRMWAARKGLNLELTNEQNLCPNCGDDRTGKGSLIIANTTETFCNEACYREWVA